MAQWFDLIKFRRYKAGGYHTTDWVAYHSKTTRKPKFQDFILGEGNVIPHIRSRNNACFASFRDQVNEFRGIGKTVNRLLASYGTKNLGRNLFDTSQIKSWRHVEVKEIVTRKMAEFYLKESKKLGLLPKDFHVQNYLEYFDIMINLNKVGLNKMYFYLTQARFLLEYIGIVGYYWEVIQLHPDIDRYIAMTLALIASGGSNGHSYFNMTNIFIRRNRFDPPTLSLEKIVEYAYKLKLIGKGGIFKEVPVAKSKIIENFSCSSTINNYKIKDSVEYPKEYEDLKTFQLGEIEK